MNIGSDKAPADQMTLGDVKAFIAKLDLLEISDDAIMFGRVSFKSKAIHLWVDTERHRSEPSTYSRD